MQIQTKRLTVGLILATWLANASAANVAPWGRHDTPVPDGVKLSVEVDHAQYFLGENVLLHLCVKNTGDKPFSIHFGGDYRGSTRAQRFKVSAVDEKGVETEDPDPSGMNMGGIGGGETIEPGKSWYWSLPLLRYRRIDKPGRYTVRVSHDFGWKEDPNRPHPVGEIKITFVTPTEQQAEQTLVAMLALPDGTQDFTHGSKRPAYRDFTVIRSPVYLRPLTRLAEEKNAEAIEGIGSIDTPEASAELVRLMNDASTEIAETIVARLPDPEVAADSKAPWTGWGKSPAAKKACWNDELTSQLRPKARALLESNQNDLVDLGADMLRNVGMPEDQRGLLAALDRELKVMPPRTGDDANGLGPPGTAGAILWALAALRHRGAPAPLTPATPGEIELYLQSLECDYRYRPVGWYPRSTEWLKHPNPFIRESSLRALMTPLVKPDVGGALPALLSDPDQGVQRTACEYAEQLGDSSMRPLVLKVLETARATFLVKAANDAAVALGGTADACDIWIRRMSEPKMLYPAMSFLARTIKYPGHGMGGNTGNVQKQEIAALQARWTEFLSKHRERIQSGRLFEIGDPEITPDLFGKVLQFGLEDGRSWPEPK